MQGELQKSNLLLIVTLSSPQHLTGLQELVAVDLAPRIAALQDGLE